MHSSFDTIPRIGFGVGTAWYNNARGEDLTADGVKNALLAGYKLIDDAEMYQNEVSVGKGIAAYLEDSTKLRSYIWVTSKVHASISTRGVAGIEEAAVASLQKLGPSLQSYFDLYLLHAPFKSDGDSFNDSLPSLWRAMEDLVKKGIAHRIGVSNFRSTDLRNMLSEGVEIKPYCNQIERHPSLLQPELTKTCKDLGIKIVAYGPLVPLTFSGAGGKVRATAELIATSRVEKSTAAKILLAHALVYSDAIVTTTSKVERLPESLSAENIVLTLDEIAQLDSAGKEEPLRKFWHQVQCPSVVWD